MRSIARALSLMRSIARALSLMRSIARALSLMRSIARAPLEVDEFRLHSATAAPAASEA
jgi:hypothetical protein